MWISSSIVSRHRCRRSASTRTNRLHRLLNSYRIARRDDGDRPMLVAIDEIQVLLGLEQPPDLAWLAEQCRSQRIGLIPGDPKRRRSG